MTKEELLRTRYKVIADYPGNYWRIGDILYPFDKELERAAGLPEINRYPHLFKPLQWYDDRTIDEMPAYFRSKTARPETITKVDNWWLDNDGNWWADYKGHSHNLNMWAIEPANEQEYLDYLTQQNKKA